jgi:hypothetical protein
VLVLGSAFYDGYPGAVRIASWEQLAVQLATLPRGRPRQPTGVPMALYLERCFPGTFDYMSRDSVEPSNLDHLARPLLDRFGVHAASGRA